LPLLRVASWVSLLFGLLTHIFWLACLMRLTGLTFSAAGAKARSLRQPRGLVCRPHLRSLHETMAPHCLAALTDSRWTLFLSKRRTNGWVLPLPNFTILRG